MGKPVVLITGAGHGLGREVARQLAGAGRQVVIATRDPQHAQQAAAELGNDVTALSVGLDVTQADSVTGAVAALTSEPGRLAKLG